MTDGGQFHQLKGAVQEQNKDGKNKDELHELIGPAPVFEQGSQSSDYAGSDI